MKYTDDPNVPETIVHPSKQRNPNRQRRHRKRREQVFYSLRVYATNLKRNYSYQMPDKDPVHLPKGMEMELLTAQSEMLDEGVGQIRFYPDGSSGGGRVTLMRGEARWEIEVEWLTGKVRLLDPNETDDR